MATPALHLPHRPLLYAWGPELFGVSGAGQRLGPGGSRPGAQPPAGPRLAVHRALLSVSMGSLSSAGKAQPPALLAAGAGGINTSSLTIGLCGVITIT